MLRLDASPQVTVSHDETGCEFTLKHIHPRDNQKMLKRAKDKRTGEVDFIVYNGLVVDAAVIEWAGVGGAAGELPATEEHKRTLGEKFPSIANFIFGKATDVKLFCDEVDAAKND